MCNGFSMGNNFVTRPAKAIDENNMANAYTALLKRNHDLEVENKILRSVNRHTLNIISEIAELTEEVKGYKTLVKQPVKEV